MNYLKTALLATNLIFSGICTTAFADDAPRDSSADSAGFIQDIRNAHGVVLRVPINDKGEENTAAAIMKVNLTSKEVTTSTDLPTLWSAGKPLDESTLLSADSPTDSSTWGWYGYRHHYGWAQPYYYRSYYPSASYYGNYYNYYPSYYSSYYYPTYNYGYRYYYYGCNY